MIGEIVAGRPAEEQPRLTAEIEQLLTASGLENSYDRVNRGGCQHSALPTLCLAHTLPCPHSAVPALCCFVASTLPVHCPAPRPSVMLLLIYC